MPDEFYKGTDWQESSSPSTTRAVHKEANDDTALLWPVGGSFDSLVDADGEYDGVHPILAIGRKANRPMNVTGVVVAYNPDVEIATMDVADKKIVSAYVANIAGYDGEDANSWQNTVYPLDPVYVDDSADVAALGAGVTLSFSSTNEAGNDNPLAGYVFWCQDEYADQGVGGPNSTQGIDQPSETDTSEALTLCILMVNDAGEGGA